MHWSRGGILGVWSWGDVPRVYDHGVVYWLYGPGRGGVPWVQVFVLRSSSQRT